MEESFGSGFAEKENEIHFLQPRTLIYRWINDDLAPVNENDKTGDRVALNELVDERMKHPNSTSETDKVVQT